MTLKHLDDGDQTLVLVARDDEQFLERPCIVRIKHESELVRIDLLGPLGHRSSSRGASASSESPQWRHNKAITVRAGGVVIFGNRSGFQELVWRCSFPPSRHVIRVASVAALRAQHRSDVRLRVGEENDGSRC